MKKFFLIFTLVVLQLSGFNAQAGIVKPGEANTTTITIWHSFDGAYLTTAAQIFDQYEADHPGVTINLYKPANFIPELDDAIWRGMGPDLILGTNDAIGSQISKNQIIDLDQLGVTLSWLTNTFEPSAVQGVQYRSKIWALPIATEGIALIYNKALVTSDYLPTDPLDFAALRAKAQSFKNDTGKRLICNQGFPGGDSYHFAPVFFGFGIPSYIDDYDNVYANSPAAINAGEWLASMPSLSPAAQDYASCQSQLLNGQVGMWWTGPWALGSLNVPGFSYGIISMGRPFVSVKTGSITTNAKARGSAATALDILETFTNAANSKTLTLANKTVPANTAALNDPEVQAIPTIKGFGAALHNGIPMNSSPYSDCQWVPIGEAETAIWTGAKTPTQALNTAQTQIQACIKNTITIWHPFSGTYLSAIAQIINQYKTDHPGVTINLYRPGNIVADLAAVVPSGMGPDIVLGGNDLIGSQANKNQIIDLNQLGVTSIWLSSTYEPAAVQGVQYRSKIWAIPFATEGIALVYNKNMVTAGYLPSDPLDFTALRAKAQSFLTDKGKPLICNPGFPGNDAYHIAPVFFGFGVPAYVDENGQAYANTPEAINAGNWLASMPPFSLAAQNDASCQDGLLNGQVGMWWTGPWAIAELEAQGFQFGIVSMGKPFVNIQSGMITINANQRGHADTALDIITTLGNTANSKTLALNVKIIPANTAALHDPDVQALSAVSGFGAAMSSGVPMSPSPYSACQWDPLGDAEVAIWTGSQTPTQALNTAQTQIQACIKNLQPRLYLPVIIK